MPNDGKNSGNDPIRRQIDELTDEEREVLGQIAMNCDEGHDPAILQSLLDKELIEQEATGYFTPIYIHVRWCQWCSDHYGDQE
jgi:hypothetical protein